MKNLMEDFIKKEGKKVKKREIGKKGKKRGKKGEKWKKRENSKKGKRGQIVSKSATTN